MSARDELARAIVDGYGIDADVECPCRQDYELADALLAAGYRKPRVLGYVIVDGNGGMQRHHYFTREAAQEKADEYTKQADTAGTEMSYRVVEIVEAGA